MARRRKRNSSSVDDARNQLARQLDETGKALQKLDDAAKKSGEGLGKFAQGMTSFLLSPATNNIASFLGHIESSATNVFGAAAQSMGIPGAGTARDAFAAVSAFDATGGQLGGIAEQYGRAGIALDPAAAEAIRARLQKRNELAAQNSRVAADVMHDFLSPKRVGPLTFDEWSRLPETQKNSYDMRAWDGVGPDQQALIMKMFRGGSAEGTH